MSLENSEYKGMLSHFFFQIGVVIRQVVFSLYVLCFKAVVQLLLVRKSCEIIHDLLSLRNPIPRASRLPCLFLLLSCSMDGYEGL